MDVEVYLTLIGIAFRMSEFVIPDEKFAASRSCDVKFGALINSNKGIGNSPMKIQLVRESQIGRQNELLGRVNSVQPDLIDLEYGRSWDNLEYGPTWDKKNRENFKKMKLQISVIALAARCVYGRCSEFEVFPRGGMRCVTETFRSQIEAAIKRNLNVPNNIHSRDQGYDYISEVYQVNEPAPNHTKLFAREGWGLKPGKMTQYRFSLIGNNQKCTIGITNWKYFNSERVFILGLDLSKGELLNYKQSLIGRIELDNDLEDIDWFMDYHINGSLVVRVSLNGEPIKETFEAPFYSDRNNGADVGPLLYCEGHMDSAEGIAVTQYSPRTFMMNWPYVPPWRHTRYELKNPGAFLPKERLGSNKFPENFSVKIKIEDDSIEISVLNTIICSVKMHDSGKYGTERKPCMITMYNVEEPYSSLENYLGLVMMKSTEFTRKSSGNVEVNAEGFKTLELTRREYAIVEE